MFIIDALRRWYHIFFPTPQDKVASKILDLSKEMSKLRDETRQTVFQFRLQTEQRLDRLEIDVSEIKRQLQVLQKNSLIDTRTMKKRGITGHDLLVQAETGNGTGGIPFLRRPRH